MNGRWKIEETDAAENRAKLLATRLDSRKGAEKVSVLAPLFDPTGYVQVGDQLIGAVDAEEAVCIALLRENDALSKERARELATDLIRSGRSVHVVVITNRLRGHYFGRDPFGPHYCTG